MSSDGEVLDKAFKYGWKEECGLLLLLLLLEDDVEEDEALPCSGLRPISGGGENFFFGGRDLLYWCKSIPLAAATLSMCCF